MEQKIPEIARKAIIDRLILIGEVTGGNSYCTFFERVYPECKKILCNRTTLAAEISQHCDRFPGDWGDENGIFSEVGINNWTDEQFLFFCQEYVNPVFKRSRWNAESEERIDLQPQCVEAINLYLKDCGYELKPADQIGDKIKYEIESCSGVKGQIQGIVFAAVHKPEILFTDFLNQNVEIPVNPSVYLYYDKKIPSCGLKWSELKQWYADSRINCGESLIERLMKSVENCHSPLEPRLFKSYLDLVEQFGEEIPAILPQVYLYYDSKTQKERLKKIFDHQCMDFLLLFSESHRVVIEIDGIQHYAFDDKIAIPNRQYPIHEASVDRYASMVAAQREMTLAGYEVYRFGGKELYDADKADVLIKKFFKDLFQKYGVI
ncbi:MAG: hypothetical protein WBK46_08915 [Ruminococcus flavefaciens]